MITLKGKIIRGKNRGKKLGYPTANFKLNLEIPQGIYISNTKYKNKLYKSVTFIGNSKTFNEDEVMVETHILDFDENLYGNNIKIELHKKIRENYKFGTIKELIARIEKDVEIAREYFDK